MIGGRKGRRGSVGEKVGGREEMWICKGERERVWDVDRREWRKRNLNIGKM